MIELDGTLATVEEVGLRSTRLRGLDDTLLHVPNSQLSDRIIANWGRRRRRKLAMTVGVTYDTPRAKLDRFVDRLRAVVLDQPDTDPKMSMSAFRRSARRRSTSISCAISWSRPMVRRSWPSIS
ncbi:MAG: mechanosensitive ion channel [Rhodobacteraceae bacterium]|nr:mechanosensitive ion channel [Paracoccaceae bacterium]